VRKVVVCRCKGVAGQSSKTRLSVNLARRQGSLDCCVRRKWSAVEYGEATILDACREPGERDDAVGLTYGADAANNGNVASQTITLGPVAGPAFVATQNYGYDPLNRLETAVEGSNWRQKFGYDRWGNRWIVEGAGNTENMPPVSGTGAAVEAANYDQTRNRLAVPTDNAGNASVLAGRTMKYDVENRLVSITGGSTVAQSMVYDGDGRRVVRMAGG
jgi:YD repeat-containing protein